MGSLITKHKYYKSWDYKVTIDEKKYIDFDKLKFELYNNSKKYIKLIEKNVFIFCVSNKMIKKFENYIQTHEPFNKYNLYKFNLQGDEIKRLGDTNTNDIKKDVNTFYCFQFSLEKIPVIQKNGYSIGVYSVLYFKYQNEYFTIFVKDKIKNFFSNVGGKCKYNENIKDCLKREIKEEIYFENNLLIPETYFAYANDKSTIPVFGYQKINNFCCYFKTFINQKESEKWIHSNEIFKSFDPKKNVNIFNINNDEINKIAFIKLNSYFFTSSLIKIDGLNLSQSSHDLCCYSLQSLADKSDNIILNRNISKSLKFK